MTDLITRLRDTPNWMRESYGSWKDCVLKYDRAPFEAADEIERLRTVLQRIAEFPRQRNDELSIEGARALARAALKETP